MLNPEFLKSQFDFAHEMAVADGGTWAVKFLKNSLDGYCAVMEETGIEARRLASETGTKDTVAVLLVFSRPASVEPIVRALLCAPSIRSVVLSINNPDLEIPDTDVLDDPRVSLIKQPTKTAPGIRVLLARDTPAEHYVLIDDDVFLRPAQIEGLISASRAEPWRAHGILGEVYDRRPGTEQPRTHIGHFANDDLREHSGDVDVLNTTYVFSRSVLERSFGLARHLDVGDLAAMRNGEDILLSLSGLHHPRVHDLGPYGECVSARVKGIATWRSLESFHEERAHIYDCLERVHRRLAKTTTKVAS